MHRILVEGVYSVGAIDWDRRIFDELVSTPKGTSYNSYLIKDEKTVLIDTVEPFMISELFKNLDTIGVEKIDYVVANHAEQDHSGGLGEILKRHPEAKIITNPKAKAMILDLMDLPEDSFITVGNEQEISIGKRTLQFIYMPWVHWPETMATYDIQDKLLFTCDFFGSHYATSDVFANDRHNVYNEAKRYYAEIMMPFKNLIKGHLKKIRGLDVDIIAPSHGPAYDDPDFILKAYEEWVADKDDGIVLIAYVSMHGSTKIAVEYLERILVDQGINTKIYNLITSDLGDIAMSIVDAKTLIIGSPTVLGGAHPAAISMAHFAKILRPSIENVGIISSYGWGGQCPQQVMSLLSPMKIKQFEPVLIKGAPKEKDFDSLKELAKKIIDSHKEVK
jgi:flavorubredoxin